MDAKLFRELIDGTFRPELDPEKQFSSLLIQNFTQVPVQPKFWTDMNMGLGPLPVILPPFTMFECKTLPHWHGPCVGDCIIFTSAVTGSLIHAAVLDEMLWKIQQKTTALPASDVLSGSRAPSWDSLRMVTANGEFVKQARLVIPQVGCDWRNLMAPNNIGEPPGQHDMTLIPTSSPRILVGIGEKAVGELGEWDALLHEQYWQRSGKSFSLPPHSKKEISIVHRSGRTETSSSLETVSSTVGAQASAGWGPVSASISASLSRSSTVGHSLTLTEETESSMIDTFENEGDEEELVLFWNIVDVYTWVSRKTNMFMPMASIEMVQSPPITRRYLTPKAVR